MQLTGFLQSLATLAITACTVAEARRELGSGDLHLNETNIRAAYRDEGLEVDSLLEFLRYLLDLECLSAYRDIVTRQFSDYIACQAFNADQIHFLRAVQNVFLQTGDKVTYA